MLKNSKIENKADVSLLMKIILFISLFSSSFVFFKYPFEFYFHYILFIILIPLFVFKFGFPKLILKILILPFIVGLVNVLLNNYLPFDFIKIFGGLLITFLFYYYILDFHDFNVHNLFQLYIKFCYLICLIGFVQLVSFYIGFKWGYDYSWLFNKWGVIKGGLFGIRVTSILAEPSQLALVVSPASYIAIRNLIHKQDFILSKIQSIVILFVLISTTSTLGYFGILLSLLFVTESFRIRYIVIGLVLSVVLFQIAYNNVIDFKSRVDSAVGLWINNDFNLENTNNSSFVLFNNLHIAKEILIEHPIFGTGLGSHEAAFNKHTLTGKVIQYDFAFNKKDGNSLLIRLCTETGLIGVIFLIFISFKCFIWKINNNELIKHKIISQGIFVLIILTLIRQGNYMLNGLPFLFLIYYYNYISYNHNLILNSDCKDEE